VQGSGSRVYGEGLRIEGVECRVEGLTSPRPQARPQSQRWPDKGSGYELRYVWRLRV